MLFGQTFELGDLAVIGLLVVLEGALSIDNALVLGLLAKRLPKHQQRKALTYGLVGAFAFRLIAVATAAVLLRWRFVKILGGAYLVYVALKHFLFERKPASDAAPVGFELSAPAAVAGFWSTVAVIELTDVAFAVDSILAAIALVSTGARAAVSGPHPKLWVVIGGGMLGVVLMRFAASVFIKLLERFPRFEVAAYLLVCLIGTKLLADWAANSPQHPDRLNFHSYHSLAFWVFWGLMGACFSIGFLPRRVRSSGTLAPLETVHRPADGSEALEKQVAGT